MNNFKRSFARAILLWLAVLLSACQVMAAPVPAPAALLITSTIVEIATATATPAPSLTRTSTPWQPVSATATASSAASAAMVVSPTSTTVGSATETPTPIPVVFFPAGRVEVPILMYHRIRNDGATRYITTIPAFREQMQALRDAGYHTITIDLLAKAISQGADLPVNPIVLTFDDGYLDVYQNAFPVMKEMGFVGVTYIITVTFEKEKAYGYMQPPELKALAASGWEIGSHSITHTDLKASRQGIGNEVQKSRDILEEKLGVKIHSFAYPFGVSNPWIEDLVKKSGYEAAVGIGMTITHTQKRLYYLSRKEVYRGITLDQFRALLTPGEADKYVGTPAVTPTP